MTNELRREKINTHKRTYTRARIRYTIPAVRSRNFPKPLPATPPVNASVMCKLELPSNAAGCVHSRLFLTKKGMVVIRCIFTATGGKIVKDLSGLQFSEAWRIYSDMVVAETRRRWRRGRSR